MRTETILSITEPKKKYRSNGLAAETVLAVLLLLGELFAVKELYSSDRCLPLATGCGILCIFTTQLSAFLRKHPDSIRRLWHGVAVVGFAAGFSFLTQGFLMTVDQLIYLINQRFGTEFLLFSVNSRAGIGVLLMWSLIGVELAQLLLSEIRKKRLWVIVLGVLITFGFGCICQSEKMWNAVLCLVPALLGCMVYYGGIRRFPRFRENVLLVSLVLISLGAAAGTNLYGRSEALESWKKNRMEDLEAFRFGSDSLPHGEVRKASGLLDGEEERLIVQIDSPQELYLRGFTGGSYSRNGWKELPFTDYQDIYAGMLQWLKSQNLIPQTQYAAYQMLTEQHNENSLQTTDVKVGNTGAYRKYVYLPATASGWESSVSKTEKDHNVLSHALQGAAYYQFQMCMGDQTAEKLVAADWLMNPSGEAEDTYLNAEAVYHSFVEEYDTEIDAEAEEIIKEFFFPDGTEGMDFSELTSQIRRLLRTDAEYTRYPEAVPADTDLLTWFLKERHGGNAVAYATAAVMAYRSAGYPARYVEGYHLSETDAEAMKEAGQTEAILTTQNAHAWVEVYMAGVGWLPVEVVPGFYMETYTTETVEGKPAYQVNSLQDQQGMETKEQTGTSAGVNSQTEAEKNAEPGLQLWISEWLIVALYVLLTCYLLLELQRALRLRIVKRKESTEDIGYCVEEMERLMRIGGIQEGMSQPLELWKQVQQAFPGVEKEEYMRVVELIQSARFGGRSWKTYEHHTVRCYTRHLRGCLYQNHRGVRRLWLRYVELI